jgi:hypothetical protein
MIGAYRDVGGIAPFGNNVQIDVQQGRLYMGSAEVDAKEIVGCLVHVGVSFLIAYGVATLRHAHLTATNWNTPIETIKANKTMIKVMPNLQRFDLRGVLLT